MFISSHRCRVGASAAVIAMLALGGPARAQNTPGGNHEDNGGLNGSLSHADLERLRGDHKQDSSAAAAAAREQSAKLVVALELSCDISDAKLVVNGTSRPASGGKAVETRVYEVACKGGTGYLFETQGSDMPIAISCVAAEEARAADVAKGKEPGFFCKLPDNKDVYAMLTSLIATGAGAQCAILELRAFGRSESSKSEYSEVSCKDGKGFLVSTALPGSQAKTTVMSCAEAAKQGIKCRLTDSGPVETPVTLDTFKGALAQNGVACKIDQLRTIGQEDHRKRYVVEYLCAAAAAGKVAFIPLQGNTNPYESLDCSAAALDGIACTLAPAK